MSVGSYLKHAWNVFTNSGQENKLRYYEGESYSASPHRGRLWISNERSIISSIYTRLAIDTSSVEMRHVRTDDQNRYTDDIDSGLNNCLTVEANMDQAARAFRQDIAMTLFDKGCVALVPVDTSINPLMTGGYDIITLRVGEIIRWYPNHVRMKVYNEATGGREEITLQKKVVAIIENPLYTVMNEPNSTLQRLIKKLNILDAIDEQSGSGKLDILIQLPYVIKSEARRQQAEQRRTDIEFQLKGSKYGIAYTDATEKITQLNRPVENNLLGQIEFLTEMLYGQLGLTKEVMNGTADEKTMLNYWNRSIEPILTAVVESMRRTFLTKTARTQKQTVMFFRDPFRLVPIENIAEIADKFTRNEIMSSNEMRQVVGMKPHADPKADQLVNSNMPQADTGVPPAADAVSMTPADPALLASSFDQIDSAIDDALLNWLLLVMGMAMGRPNSVPLMHVKAPYDPVKAHEYYLRVRELKGRGKGAQGFTVRSNGKETRLSQQQLVEQQAYAAKRVNDIKKRLADLTSQLRKAMSEARRKKAKSDHEASKPKTAAEKSKAARESKKYQKKHQGELATKKKQADAKKSKTKTKADPVAELEAKIEKVKGSLRAAVAIQRSLASATKNT